MLNLSISENPDILREVSIKYPNIITIVFAAETENIIENAQNKLKTKQCNAIVANIIGFNQGFKSDDNELIIFTHKSKTHKIKKNTKYNLSFDLMDYICSDII